MSFDCQKLLFGTDDSRLFTHMQKFNISEKMLKESVQHIRIWFKLQPHMPKINLAERFLVRTLASNRYSIEKSKEKIENLFTAKSIMPEFFKDRDTFGPVVMHSKKICEWVSVPKADKYRVIVYRFNENYINEFDPITSHRVGLMGTEIRMYYETNFDTVLIIDLSGMRFGHIIKFDISSLTKILFLYQKCYSTKVINIHAVNVPSFSVSFLNAMKGLLKKKLAERMLLHDSFKSLHDYIDLDYLPKELGGHAGTYGEISELNYKSLQSDEWRKRLMESEHEKTDESKRLESTKGKFNLHLGIEGSFRKLDFD